MESEYKSDFSRADRLQTTVTLAPPFLWFAHLNVSYAIAPGACIAGNRIPLHLATVVAIAVLVAAGWYSWAVFRESSRTEQGTNTGDTRDTRRRFMSLLGVAFSVLFTLLIIANEVPNFTIRSCG